MNELKLIRKCQRGEVPAFNELITFYYPFVFKFLLKMSGKKEISEDLTQEVFIKITRNIDHFNVYGKAKFSTYLMQIAKNTYLDYLKVNKKVLQETSFSEVENNIIYTDKYENLNIDKALSEIEKLPFLQKEAIKLKYLEGYTLEEIAKKQGVSSKRVKSRLFEGRKKLREKMKGWDTYE